MNSLFSNQVLADNQQNPSSSWSVMLIYLVVIGAIFYFMIIRPNKKNKAQEQKLLNDIQVGDEIVTIGGVCGRVVSVKDETFVVESGPDRTKMVFEKFALKKNNSAAGRE